MNPNTQNPGMWGAIASAVSGITTTIINTSPKTRDANVQIAEANARAAEANASSGTGGMNPKVIGIIVVVAVIGIVLAITLKK